MEECERQPSVDLSLSVLPEAVLLFSTSLRNGSCAPGDNAAVLDAPASPTQKRHSIAVTTTTTVSPAVSDDALDVDDTAPPPQTRQRRRRQKRTAKLADNAVFSLLCSDDRIRAKVRTVLATSTFRSRKRHTSGTMWPILPLLLKLDAPLARHTLIRTCVHGALGVVPHRVEAPPVSPRVGLSPRGDAEAMLDASDSQRGDVAKQVRAVCQQMRASQRALDERSVHTFVHNLYCTLLCTDAGQLRGIARSRLCKVVALDISWLRDGDSIPQNLLEEYLTSFSQLWVSQQSADMDREQGAVLSAARDRCWTRRFEIQQAQRLRNEEKLARAKEMRSGGVAPVPPPPSHRIASPRRAAPPTSPTTPEAPNLQPPQEGTTEAQPWRQEACVRYQLDPSSRLYVPPPSAPQHPQVRIVACKMGEIGRRHIHPYKPRSKNTKPRDFPGLVASPPAPGGVEVVMAKRAAERERVTEPVGFDWKQVAGVTANLLQEKRVVEAKAEWRREKAGRRMQVNIDSIFRRLCSSSRHDFDAIRQFIERAALEGQVPTTEVIQTPTSPLIPKMQHPQRRWMSDIAKAARVDTEYTGPGITEPLPVPKSLCLMGAEEKGDQISPLLNSMSIAPSF